MHQRLFQQPARALARGTIMHLAHYDGSLSRYDPRTLVTPESVLVGFNFKKSLSG